MVWNDIWNGLSFFKKVFMHLHFIFTCTINLLKSFNSQSSNDTGCSVGLRHLMDSILKPEEDLNYFYKFMPLLTQNKIFEIYLKL